MATDDKEDDNKEQTVDHGRRRFLAAATTVVGGIGAASASVPFVASWLPSEKVQAAGGPIKVDVSNMQYGEQITVEWRGKPVWIIKRTKQEIERMAKHHDRLRDPNSEVDQQPPYVDKLHRGIKSEYVILVGICTHLGCSPMYKPYLEETGADWPGGFFCPCHGSMFDLAGRVFKGVPAPINLAVPPHHFLSDTVVVIGEDKPRSNT